MNGGQAAMISSAPPVSPKSAECRRDSRGRQSLPLREGMAIDAGVFPAELSTVSYDQLLRIRDSVVGNKRRKAACQSTAVVDGCAWA